jgi:hypothetical protein
MVSRVRDSKSGAPGTQPSSSPNTCGIGARASYPAVPLLSLAVPETYRQAGLRWKTRHLMFHEDRDTSIRDRASGNVPECRAIVVRLSAGPQVQTPWPRAHDVDDPARHLAARADYHITR